MTTPVATYRLQLRGGMTFAKAAKLAPYFANLGISHLYLSPIFKAAPGSTHGYDATDFNEIEPELGGLRGFLDLIAELDRHGLKVIVDFVPNHMAAHPENTWWRDVIEWGEQSRYSNHFDIDWSVSKLILPTLGKPYGTCLNDRELAIEFYAVTGEFVVRYFDHAIPINPASYGQLLALTEDHALRRMGDAFSRSSTETAPKLKQELAAIDSGKRQAIETALQNLNSDAASVHAVLEQQLFRLAYWRAAREALNYRRFFEISDLVGVRVEKPDVFADVHRTVLSLIRDGKIVGLRIDHIDGLADPLKYLRDLRQATAEIPDFYIIVEKILGEHEEVRPEWPIEGTTGYEFIRDVGALFVPSDLECIDRGYREFTGIGHDYDAETLDVKRQTLTFNLASELSYLTSTAFALGQANLTTRDFGRDTLRSAIIELAVHLSIYRTYIDPSGPCSIDRKILAEITERAKASRTVEDHAAIDFIIALLSSKPPSRDRALAEAFVVRFQQTTGPLMAKAVEDTEFYRFNRLIALNEVGGDPSLSETGPDQFHAAMSRRQQLSPRALTATATHDTKRGEDARTRLYSIGVFQKEWCDAVGRWSKLLADRTQLGAIDHEMEWLFYQGLAGAWPDISTPSKDFVEQILEFMLKAAREAKLRTNWTNPDSAYEKTLETFVRTALETREFVEDFSPTIQPLIVAGRAFSLVQLVLKMFSPGIPDVYQGTELWDLALVDPDNRRPVDYQPRMDFLSSGEIAHDDRAWRDGSLKLGLLRACLLLRRKIDFTHASYEPLAVEGEESSRAIAFARRNGDDVLIVIAALEFSQEIGMGGPSNQHASRWQNTRVRLPLDLKEYPWFADAFFGTNLAANDGHIDIAKALEHLPVAVLHSAR